MKAVIDGLLYDTDTATEICDISNGYSTNDFKYRSGKLYKTPNGRYFAVGSGGANSMFAVQVGNSRMGSTDRIVALDMHTARALAEHYASVNTITEFFTVEEA